MRSAFKDKMYAFFIAQFDASLIILPFIFKRAGWLTCSIMMVILSIAGIFGSILVYQCVRLLLSNYRMRQQGIDFESLLSNFKHIATHGSFTDSNSTPWLSRTFASSTMVSIVRQLYILSLIMCSAIGLILCQYTSDNIFRWLNGGSVYAL